MRHAHSNTDARKGHAGFSLIEVNMAILVVAGGLLSLFSLFPAGLRMSSTALADTRQSLFASDMLNRIRANAETISMENWQDPAEFWKLAAANTGLRTTFKNPESDILGELDGPPAPTSNIYYVADKIDKYFTEVSDSGANVGLPSLAARYLIRLNRDSGTITGAKHLDLQTWRISMVVSDQPDILFHENPIYHLEIRYAGKP